jgi:uncharacterized protein (DUF362 family)/NAD-dependent dihydropyrimidine dehydrogenase PreA subunit
MKSKVAVVKCESYNISKVYSAVKKAVEISGFVIPKKCTVLLKPNILMPKAPEYAITTHPSIVDAVCRLLSENKCRIIIGESDGGGNTFLGFEASGIKKVADKYRAKLVAFEKDEKRRTACRKNKVLKEIFFPKTVLDADLIINLPKLKTHSLTKYTGAVKNMYGTIPGATKSIYHRMAPEEKKFCELILDIYDNVRPGFTIMDGIVGMEGAGPSTGTPRESNLIIAGKDGVAVDYISSKLIGFDPNEIFTTSLAFKRKISDEKGISAFGEKGRLDERDLKNYYAPYKRLPVFNSRLMIFAMNVFSSLAPKPVVSKRKCVGCRVCEKHCPVSAITFDKYPVIDRKKCIKCFCCIELCPYKAMTLKTSILLLWMKGASGLLNKLKK